MAVCAVATACYAAAAALPPSLREVAAHVNADPASTWVADESVPPAAAAAMGRMLGLRAGEARVTLPERPRRAVRAGDIPARFDAREAWPQCASIGEVWDQGECGSCWAFGPTEAATDRVCIASNGTVTTRLSPEHMMTCCGSCGGACDGGHPQTAWDFIRRKGLVSGAQQGDPSGCQEYRMPKCNHHRTAGSTYPTCPKDILPSPRCELRCDDPARPFDADKTRFASAYTLPKDVQQIQAEILAHGPVATQYDVYSDFYTYKSGVYSRSLLAINKGGHVVKIIGWGVAGSTPYWLVANSWNEEWGENGFFRIRRGLNECGIEALVTAGLPHGEAPPPPPPAPRFDCSAARVPEECRALVDLYVATRGDEWNDRVSFLNASKDVCGWHYAGLGVSGCDTAGHVTHLTLPYNDLDGTIPESIGDLTLLEEMQFYENRMIRGALPASLRRLTSVGAVNFRDNQMSGALDGGIISGLGKLYDLELRRNNFSGPLPTVLCNMSKLVDCELDDNQFSSAPDCVRSKCETD